MAEEPLIKMAGIRDLFYVLDMGDWLYSIFEYMRIPQWFGTLFANLISFGINGAIWAGYIRFVAWVLTTHGIN